MRTLLILRHAKSSWDDPALPDRDRPLNDRGRRDAPRMGHLLRDERLVPDLILCSTAIRARRTAEHVSGASGYRGRVRHLASLYHGDPHGILRLVRALPVRCGRVLVVGHNPVLEDLVELLAGRRERMPTAALVRIDADVASWKQLRPGRGRVAGVWRRKELRG